MAGEAFDHLVGPWIEREDIDRFRISPLLTGAANEILSSDEIRGVHTAIASDYLKRKTVSQYEFATAFFHAFLAKESSVLAIMAAHLVSMESRHLSSMYEAIIWFAHVGLEVRQRIVEDNPNAEFVLRMAQFKLIAASTNVENVPKVIDRIEDALLVIDDSEYKEMAKSMAYGTVLSKFDIFVSSKTAVRMLSSIIDASTTPRLQDIYQKFADRPPGTMSIADNRPEQILFSFQAARIRGLDDLDELVDAIDELPEKKRDVLLAVCEKDAGFSNLLVNRAWWGEAKTGDLDVGRTVATLQKVESMSRKWKTAHLILACQVAIAVIYDEYGHSIESALEIVDAAEIEFPENANLANQKSKILFHSERWEESLFFADRALALPGLSRVEFVFTCRSAGMAAEKIGNWERATDYFERGATLAVKSAIQKPMGVGLMADAAFGYWKQCKWKESIVKFAEVVTQLELMPPADDLRLRHLHATVRHCIAWIHFQSKKEKAEQIHEPRPGMCSNQEPHADMKDQRLIDIAAVWLLLFRIEQDLNIDCGIGKQPERFSEEKQPLIMAGYKRTSDLKAALKAPGWRDVIPAFIRMHEAMARSRELMVSKDDGIGWQVGEIPQLPADHWKEESNWTLIFETLLAAFINCVARYPDRQLPIDQWRKDVEAICEVPKGVDAFLKVLKGDSSDGSLHQEVAATLFLVQRGLVSSKDLWKTSFLLLNAFERMRDWSEDDIEVLVTSRWTFALEQQRFSFTTPQFSIPALKTACEDRSKGGLAKVARILIVAAPYLSIRMGDSAKDMLHRIAA